MAFVFAKSKFRFTGKFANTLYSAFLLIMLYDWPYQVYQKIGPRMPATTVREKFITAQFHDYAQQLRIPVKPAFVIGPAPASAGALSGNAVVVISPEMLDPDKFSDNDVRFILAHELGHIARLDAYRFWTRWTDAASETREIDADRIGVRVAGCDAMRETVAHHWNEFLKGYEDDVDHHPHPDRRLREACGTALRGDSR